MQFFAEFLLFIKISDQVFFSLPQLGDIFEEQQYCALLRKISNTVMCLSMGHLKLINFPFVSYVKFIFLGSQNLGTLQPNFYVPKYWGT